MQQVNARFLKVAGVLGATVAAALAVQPDALAHRQRTVSSSLLLLIDASGSMGDPVGGGNPEVKIEAAKRAAADALSRAASGGSVEVAVLAFSGDCQDPVPHYQDFTRDVDRLTRFIDRLQPGGGTPMADALLFANRYMQSTSGSARRVRPHDHAARRRPERLRRRRPGAGGAPGQRGDLSSRDGGIRHHAQLGRGPGLAPGCHSRPAAPTTMPPTPASSRTYSWSSSTRCR